MGFALTCDALKELGWTNFPKPDDHIKDVFSECHLCSYGTDDEIFRSLTQLALDNGVSPYKADKVFWLNCSGYYYKDGIQLSKEAAANRKAAFIANLREECGF